MMRFVVALVAVISYAAVAVGQLAYGKGFVPATALFPSSGTSCTLENSLSDGTVKNKIYWWSCTVNNTTTARFSFVSPALGATYGQAAVSVRVMTSSGSNKDICAVFSSHAYFSANALQVNQTGSNWRNTAWVGGSLGNAQQVTIAANTTPWLLMAAPALSAAGPSIIDVMNSTPNPAPSANEIVVREVIIGGCSNFCGGTTPPSCCSGGSCSTDYSGTVRIYGVHFY
jgi:hypothetical protein